MVQGWAQERGEMDRRVREEGGWGRYKYIGRKRREWVGVSPTNIFEKRLIFVVVPSFTGTRSTSNWKTSIRRAQQSRSLRRQWGIFFRLLFFSICVELAEMKQMRPFNTMLTMTNGFVYVHLRNQLLVIVVVIVCSSRKWAQAQPVQVDDCLPPRRAISHKMLWLDINSSVAGGEEYARAHYKCTARHRMS